MENIYYDKEIHQKHQDILSKLDSQQKYLLIELTSEGYMKNDKFLWNVYDRKLLNKEEISQRFDYLENCGIIHHYRIYSKTENGWNLIIDTTY